MKNSYYLINLPNAGSPGRLNAFKAFGKALRIACTLDNRAIDILPSTKESL